ncbi:MAG: transposase [Desulfobacterium sp.]|nr:transposase [Desulfobacterium sp.]
MNETYIRAREHHCPNTVLVLDRFHIVKALNETVDEIRRIGEKPMAISVKRRTHNGKI